MRFHFPVLFSCLLSLGMSASSRESLSPIPLQVIDINIKSVILNMENPAQKTAGRLSFLGGWHLRSLNPNFGGFSAMAVVNHKFVLLGDNGSVVHFTLDEQGNVARGTIAEVPKGCGRHWGKMDQDTESLTYDSRSGTYWVGREWGNAICRIDSTFRTTQKERRVPEMRRWPVTGGAEALVRLKDGRFMVFAERDRDSSNPVTPVLILSGDPTRADVQSLSLKYRAPAGYRPVDAVQLPSGHLLVLNRRFVMPFSFTSALVLIDSADIKAGAVIEGHEIARLAPPLIADNFEALALEDTKDGSILWIASDDNFLFLQRSLLLKFRLTEQRP
jgi:hypothetical protein